MTFKVGDTVKILEGYDARLDGLVGTVDREGAAYGYLVDDVVRVDLCPENPKWIPFRYLAPAVEPTAEPVRVLAWNEG